MTPIKYHSATKVTREAANEILDSLRAGASDYPPSVVNQALQATGDLEMRRAAKREWHGSPGFIAEARA